MERRVLFWIWIIAVLFGCTIAQTGYWVVVSPTRIRKITLEGQVTELVSGLTNGVACDYDLEDGYLFFTDVQDDYIKRVNLNDGSNMVTIASSSHVQHPDGLAVDWIADNVYWTDSGSDDIFVCRYDGSDKRRLVNTGLDEPRAIVLAPTEGYMWWTDWGASPKIERAWLDGSNRQAIITTGLGWPNGLAIDYATRKIFWADAKLDKIETSSYDGSNRRLLLSNVPHPFGLTVRGDHIFWTDWLLGKMEFAKKVDGSSRDFIASGFFKPMTLHLVSYERQMGTTACAADNGGCTGLCLMRPGNRCPICQPEGTDVANCNDELEVELKITQPVDVGSNVVLTCHATRGGNAVTPDSFSWQHEGQTISGQTGRTLVRDPVKAADSGMYKCEASHRGERVADTGILNVYFAPTAINWFDTPASLEVSENKQITLWCRAEASYPFVTPKFHKLLDGKESVHSSTSFKLVAGLHREKKVEVGRTITPARSDNGAVFWCVAEFSFLSGNKIERKTTQKALSVLYPMDVDLQVLRPVKEGTSMALTCKTTGGNPSVPDSYIWKLNGQTLTGENGRTLTRNPVQRSNSGTYQCDVSSRGGSGTDTEVVEVFYPPIMNLAVNLPSIKEGDHVTMTCSMTLPGIPAIIDTYSWSYKGQIIPTENGRTLIRSPVRRDQAGEYTCTATNQGGAETASASIDVKYPPDVAVTATPDTVIQGSDLLVTCETSGGNPPTVNSYVWTFNGQILHSETGRMLRRESATGQQSGTYSCSVTSDGGQNSAERSINVQAGGGTTPRTGSGTTPGIRGGTTQRTGGGTTQSTGGGTTPSPGGGTTRRTGAETTPPGGDGTTHSGSTIPQTPTQNPTGDPGVLQSVDPPGLNLPAVAGGTAGGLFFITALVIVIVCVVRRNKNQPLTDSEGLMSRRFSALSAKEVQRAPSVDTLNNAVENPGYNSMYFQGRGAPPPGVDNSAYQSNYEIPRDRPRALLPGEKPIPPVPEFNPYDDVDAEVDGESVYADPTDLHTPPGGPPDGQQKY